MCMGETQGLESEFEKCHDLVEGTQGFANQFWHMQIQIFKRNKLGGNQQVDLLYSISKISREVNLYSVLWKCGQLLN